MKWVMFEQIKKRCPIFISRNILKLEFRLRQGFNPCSARPLYERVQTLSRSIEEVIKYDQIVVGKCLVNTIIQYVHKK